MIETLTDFINNSVAIRVGDKWTVYMDGENKRGAIHNCIGNTEFEAKEDAWEYFQALKRELYK